MDKSSLDSSLLAHTLIVGCGYVGTKLAQNLRAAGAKVTGLRRTPPANTDFPILEADVVTGEGLQHLPPDISSVVYCVSADSSSEDAYQAAYVTGVRHVLSALGSSRVQHFVFVSSTAVYPQDAGEIVDEDAQVASLNFRARTLLEGEAAVADSGFPYSLVRLSGIYGPGRDWILNLSKNKLSDETERYLNLIHRDDAARLLMTLLSHGPLNGAIIGVDKEPALRSTIARFLDAQSSDTPVRQSAPESVSGRRLQSTIASMIGFYPAYPSFREGLVTLTES